MTIEYTKVGDYYFPNIKENIKISLSKYGKMKLKYLKEYQKGLYFELLSTNQLSDYLQIFEKETKEMYEQLIIEHKKQRGITENSKEKDQMKWVQEMNSIQNCINQTISEELIYEN